MRIAVIPATALVAGCVIAGAGARAPARQTVRGGQPSPPYSFVPRAPGTVQGLMRQLNNSPRLRARYANHYHTTQAEVMKFFGQKLVKLDVKQTGRYTVWITKSNGRRTAIVKTLRKGTPVLALPDGTPIVHTTCGNPFTARLPSPPKARVAKVLKVKPSTETRRRYVSVVTPFESPVGYLSESPYELPLRVSFADVPWTVVRHRTPFIPFWWKSGHDHGVPEPTTLALLGFAGLSLLVVRRMGKI